MAAAGTHIFRVALRDRPSVHRDIEIDSAKSLAKLAEAIVRAFDFEFDHAFGFYAETEGGAVMRGRPAYELFADMGEATETRSVKRTKVAEAFTEVGDAMTFLFDYGDEWLFGVELSALGRKVAKVRYPRVLARTGPSPVQYPDQDDDDDEDDDRRSLSACREGTGSPRAGTIVGRGAREQPEQEQHDREGRQQLKGGGAQHCAPEWRARLSSPAPDVIMLEAPVPSRLPGPNGSARPPPAISI